ncbi:unnamed protein product [Chironomus riparius]|uniref:RHD domain-containing protein n=2 Tax=Chironomus riparius TaxID=315576 RepID=A0A9N9RIT0_9DIPT|nr:unnamed protein product [Chironomus riparius]
MDGLNFVMDPNDNQVDGTSDLSIHISDVIAVIESTDPSAQGMFPNDLNSIAPVANHSPINGISANMPPQQSHQSNDTPYASILEQPASKALRFRYECEGRSAGSIPGANSTSDNKTYPTIQIANYVGRAVVVVSCVTKDFPYKPHPHNLVGKEGCKKGVCTLEINTDDMKMVFSNLGIQCVKRRDIEEALRVREEIRVDPFRTGYAHRSQPSSIDLNAVRLCFQVFLEGQQKGKFTVPLKPIVSDPIYDKKSMSDLVITKLSHCNAFCNGGQEMILLCEKVAKEDIQVRFYEEIMNPEEAWEGNGEFQHSQVHKQVAISFRTPRYKRIDIAEPVKVKIQLRRPSDGATSDPLDFEMLPLNEEQNEIRRKRHRSSDDAALNYFKQSPGHHIDHQQNYGGGFIAIQDQVKIEPRDQASPYIFYRIPQATPSPTPSNQNPVSPSPIFMAQVSPSPASPYNQQTAVNNGNNNTNNNNNNLESILQNQLQQPRTPGSNIFQQNQHTNQMFTPNIPPAYTIDTNGNNSIWTNNLNGFNGPTTSRAAFNSISMQSPLFSQPLTPLTATPVSNFNINNNNNEPKSNFSSLLDLDSQQLLNNLSGELKNLSFGDFPMESFSNKTDNDRSNINDGIRK